MLTGTRPSEELRRVPLKQICGTIVVIPRRIPFEVKGVQVITPQECLRRVNAEVGVGSFTRLIGLDWNSQKFFFLVPPLDGPLTALDHEIIGVQVITKAKLRRCWPLQKEFGAAFCSRISDALMARAVEIADEEAARFFALNEPSGKIYAITVYENGIRKGVSYGYCGSMEKLKSEMRRRIDELREVEAG